ncbi:MAG: hypothetical protein GY698_11030 [Actinomycetia bacterium]|nr:hypothetical protein [Actinomycetes bacterium]
MRSLVGLAVFDPATCCVPPVDTDPGDGSCRTLALRVYHLADLGVFLGG